MPHRKKSLPLLDRLLIELEHGLKTSFAPVSPDPAPGPGAGEPDTPLTPDQRRLSEGLMRINHTGEIAAQALYRGQALVAADSQLRQSLLQAAAEEQDHLQWCGQRLTELSGRPSILAPAWYAGSFLIGVVAALAGDRASLGFVEETEQQVTVHLDNHLQRLPEDDHRSRAIVTRMREDETRHAAAARAAGARELPASVKTGMTWTADLMRLISFRI